MKKHSFIGGYTMLELVIYLAIFVMVSVVVIHSLVTVMKTYTTAAAYRALQTNGDVIMERITRETRGANSVSLTNSTFGVQPGVLAIETTDTSGTDHTITFGVSNGQIQVTDNGTTSNLSSSEVTATALVFRRITSSTTDGVKIELTLTTTSGYIYTSSFYSTIMLRGNQ